LLLVFGAQQSAFGLWGAASCFWSLGRSKLLLVFGAQQAAFGLWCAASCFWSLERSKLLLEFCELSLNC
ncbi:MAG TPA: hypothetical protein ENK85_06070, partial [Saprospiraceae bacterium]|nr:hypothetical protein [Saprospiraceae bacterium]